MSKSMKIIMALALAVFMSLGTVPINMVRAETPVTTETTEVTGEETPANNETGKQEEAPAESSDPAPSAETAPAAEEVNKEEETTPPASDTSAEQEKNTSSEKTEVASEEEKTEAEHSETEGTEVPEEKTEETAPVEEETEEKTEVTLIEPEAVTYNGVTVKVSYYSDTFEEEVSLVVSEAGAAEANALKEAFGEGYKAVDISFVDNEGNKLQPLEGKSVNVSLTAEGMEAADNYRVVHVNGEGKIDEVVASVDAAERTATKTETADVVSMEPEYEEYTEDVYVPAVTETVTVKETKEVEVPAVMGTRQVEKTREVDVPASYEYKDVEKTRTVVKTRRVEVPAVRNWWNPLTWFARPTYKTEKYNDVETYTVKELVKVADAYTKTETYYETEEYVITPAHTETVETGKTYTEERIITPARTETVTKKRQVGTKPVVTGTEEKEVEVVVKDVKTAFEVTGFSVYAIVDGDHPSQIVTPRVTYYFLSEIKSDGTADPYVFINKHGDSVDYQIVKNDELLEDPGAPAVSLEKNFLGWFVVNKAEDGTYSFPAGGTRIDFSQTPPVTTTVAEGDKTVYVAPRYGQAFIVTFWDNAKGSPADQMHIVAKRVVYLDEGDTYASVQVDNVTVPSGATQTLSGWTSDDYKEGVETEYTLLEKPVWDEVTRNFNLYPVFSEGHWLRFSGGPAGSGAGYRSAIFVTANTTAADLANLGTVTRDGYTFAGWYYKGSEENPFDGTEAATNANGAALNAEDLLARVRDAEGDTTLYAHWTGNQATYRVATWFENANDDNYSFGAITEQSGYSGETTTVTAPAVTGFTAQSIEQQEIKGDGTTIVNIYYKRNIYEVRFYYEQWYRWVAIDELTISAKYEADIHDQWPGQTAGSDWPSVWNTQPGGGSYAMQITTMPLNGASYYYTNLNGNQTIRFNYYVQPVSGSRNQNDYILHHTASQRVRRASDYYTAAIGYTHMDGFSINVQPQDLGTIRTSAYDPDAQSNSDYPMSVALGTYFNQLPNNAAYYYYIRNQYDIVFNTQIAGAPAVTADFSGIYYEANIASVKSSQITALNNQYKVGETTVDVTGSGTYVFRGWYDNAACVGEQYDFNHEMPASNIPLYAKWEKVTYLVQIDPRGGEILPDVNEVTYTWLEYGKKLNQYNIRRDYVEASDDYSGDRYYYVSVLAGDDPNARADSGAYSSNHRKGFYIKTTDLNNSEYSWWKDNGFIDTTVEYMPATTTDNWAFVGWYKAEIDPVTHELTDTNEVYDFGADITGETAIYAKWRRSGLFTIQYHTENHTEDGEGRITSLINGDMIARDESYADQATTQIAHTPTHVHATDGKTYVFVGWKVADPHGFDPTDPGSATLGDTVYVQGDDFTVDANMADSGHYIHLVAVYEPAESSDVTLHVTTVTFDPNFPTDATGTSGETKKVEGVPINTAIDLSKDSFSFDTVDPDEGTTIKRTETIPEFVTAEYEQIGWNTKADGTGTAFKMNDIIGIDNEDPKENTLYAVWDIKKFYIYHSSDNTVERIPLNDPRIADGKFNIVNETKKGYLYGGYYSEYALPGYEDDAAVIAATYTEKSGQTEYEYVSARTGGFWAKDAGGTSYVGDLSSWDKTNAYTEKGNAMTPAVNTVYYLKEVPEAYLEPATYVVYDTHNEENGYFKVVKLYQMTATDDGNYTHVGFDVSTSSGIGNTGTYDAEYWGEQIDVKKVGEDYDTLTADKLVSDHVGLIASREINTYIVANAYYRLHPYFTTPDNVKVSSVRRQMIYVRNTRFKTDWTKPGMTKSTSVTKAAYK